MAKRATITDVAKFSNVSVMTVSRVSRNSANVKESTRKRVNDVIAQLNYHPDFSARALSNRVTGNIGFLVSRKKEFNDFFTHLAFAVEDSLFTQDYSVLTCMQPLNRTVVPIMISQRKIDGLIAVGHEINRYIIDACHLNDIPLVLIEGFFRKKDVILIHADFQEGIQEAVIHLLEQGHRKLAFIGNNLQNKNDQRKIASLTKTLKNYNISMPDSHVLYSDNYNQDVSVLVDVIFNRKLDVTAFICENDYLAAKLVDQFKDRNVLVPEDMGIIGFGDTDLARLKHPYLSTISVDMEKMVTMAIQELIKKINDQHIKSEHIHIPTKFIARESSKRLTKPKLDKEVMPHFNLDTN